MLVRESESHNNQINILEMSGQWPQRDKNKMLQYNEIQFKLCIYIVYHGVFFLFPYTELIIFNLIR